MDSLSPHAENSNTSLTDHIKDSHEFTVSEISKMTGVTNSALQHIAREGIVPARKLGKSWLINVESKQFKQWLEAHIHKPKVNSKEWTGKPCCIEGCDRPARSYAMCFAHVQRWVKHGDASPLTPIKEIKKRYTRKKDGYVVVPAYGHPNGDKAGYMLEHIKVMSEMIGRPLLPKENVHHKNGIRDDNRPENLELWTTSQPTGSRVSDLVKHALEIVETYGTNPETWEKEYE